ncbi:hypothetical protein ACFOWA_19880 [Pedobacter lithocola]|uniref:Uncharacterized protein n=1 Tax=Pedobacter lithocola TaxID=1908239 RepID=A0ABV8PHB5_9SPHI
MNRSLVADLCDENTKYYTRVSAVTYILLWHFATVKKIEGKIGLNLTEVNTK